MKPSKILELANKHTAKAWLRFGIGSPRQSLDPSAPPMYLIDVQGQRGDGVVFTVTVQVDRLKLDVAAPSKIVDVMAAMLNNGIQRLMTFTGCGCGQEVECEAHKRGTVN